MRRPPAAEGPAARGVRGVFWPANARFLTALRWTKRVAWLRSGCVFCVLVLILSLAMLLSSPSSTGPARDAGKGRHSGPTAFPRVPGLILLCLLSVGCARQAEIRDFGRATDAVCSRTERRGSDEVVRLLLCPRLAYCGAAAGRAKAADRKLRECVLERYRETKYCRLDVPWSPAFGGDPAFPTWYRWGYGWSYDGRHRPLSEEEKRSPGTSSTSISRDVRGVLRQFR